ncbi:hypothetical protein TB2_038301 [Malus domestica]
MVSTRSTVHKLLPFDPELEQTLRRRREKNLQWVPSLQGLFCSFYFLGTCTVKKNGVRYSRGGSAFG